jgi:hypothetical protein
LFAAHSQRQSQSRAHDEYLYFHNHFLFEANRFGLTSLAFAFKAKCRLKYHNRGEDLIPGREKTSAL